MKFEPLSRYELFREVQASVFYRGRSHRSHRCRSFRPTHETQSRIERRRKPENEKGTKHGND